MINHSARSCLISLCALICIPSFSMETARLEAQLPTNAKSERRNLMAFIQEYRRMQKHSAQLIEDKIAQIDAMVDHYRLLPEFTPAPTQDDEEQLLSEREWISITEQVIASIEKKVARLADKTSRIP